MKRDRFIRSKRTRKDDFGDRVVFEIAVIGSSEMQRRGQIAKPVGVHMGDGNAADLFRRVGIAKGVADPSARPGLRREGGLGTEGIQVKVKRKSCQRLAGEIAVG